MIGNFNPRKWQDTSKMQNIAGWKGYTDIKNGKPFLFCFVNNKIEIMNHKEDQIPGLRSDVDWFMDLVYGLTIYIDKK